jgi:hypothetical protein
LDKNYGLLAINDALFLVPFAWSYLDTGSGSVQQSQSGADAWLLIDAFLLFPAQAAYPPYSLIHGYVTSDHQQIDRGLVAVGFEGLSYLAAVTMDKYLLKSISGVRASIDPARQELILSANY